MKDRVFKLKENIKRNVPVVVATATVTTLGFVIYTKHKGRQWHNYVLSHEQLVEMSKNVDATVGFMKDKVLITGRPWDPSLDTH